jgi:hypothetical protein
MSDAWVLIAMVAMAPFALAGSHFLSEAIESDIGGDRWGLCRGLSFAAACFAMSALVFWMVAP